MLTLTFLGVGAAFAKRNYQSNALLETWTTSPERDASPSDVVLIDFGATGPLALHALKDKPGFAYLNRDGAINYPAIRRIFITHTHGDHVGGLEELAAMRTHVYTRSEKPQLLGSAEVLGSLWEHSLKGGLGAMSGRLAALEDYFEVTAISPLGSQGFGPKECYELGIFPTDHVRVTQKYDWPSYGLVISDLARGEQAVFSGDTRFDSEAMGEMMAGARIIFHEAQLEDCADPVHALLSELRTLPEAVRKKMHLYHVGDTWDDGSYGFVDQEFAGFARPAHRYVVFE